jgi:hypothetical protein
VLLNWPCEALSHSGLHVFTGVADSPGSLPYVVLVDGFAAARFAQFAQMRNLLATAFDVVEGLRLAGRPMYSERRP